MNEIMLGDAKRYLTVEHLLDLIPLKKSRVYYLVHTGEIPHFHLGRTLLFDREEIRAWIDTMKEQPCPKHT